MTILTPLNREQYLCIGYRRERRLDVVVGIALCIASAIVLRLWPPTIQHWDSLMYAGQAEGSLAGSLSWPVHVLPNFVLAALYQGAHALGYAGRSMGFLQTMNAIFGGLAASVLYVIARGLGNGRWVSCLLAILLPASYGFWHYSGTADNYSIIIPVTLVAWYSAVRCFLRPSRGSATLAGALAAVAVLSWQPHGLLVGLTVFLFMSSREPELRSVGFRRYLGAFIVVLLVGYALFTYLRQPGSLAETVIWLRGYWGNANYGNRLSLRTLPLIVRTASGAIVAVGWNSLLYRLARYLLWFFLIGIQALALLRMLRRAGKTRTIYFATLGWCLLLAAASWWFDPRSPKFWMVIYAGTLLALSTALPQWSASRSRPSPRLLATICLGVLTVGLFGFNLRSGIYPDHLMPDLPQEAAVPWEAHTQPDDLLIVGGDLAPSLRYYAGRENVTFPAWLTGTGLTTEQATEEVARQIRATLVEGKAVYLTSNALMNDVPLRSYPALAAWQWEEAFRQNIYGTEDVVVYRAVDAGQWRPTP